MAIQNITNFKKYCLRKLGAPVISIDVTDEQIHDRYEDAIKLFQQHHFDGSVETYLKHELTSTDVTNKYIPLPDNVIGITRIIPQNIGAMSSGDSALFSAQYQFLLSEMSPLWNAGNISYYVHSMQHLNLLDQMLNGRPAIRFNKVQDKLFIDTDWQRKMQPGKYVIIQARLALDPVDNPKIFDDPWFKRYTTALIKRQWGENLSKFAGVQMIGGATLNGPEIYNTALQEIEMLEQELRNTYEEPPEAIWIG